MTKGTYMPIRYFAAVAAALLASNASAADFSFTGTFGRDNQKVAYAFTTSAASTVTLTSLGYAGGTNAAGQSIASGGFDPVLSLYDATGNAVDFNDDGVGAPLDPVTNVGADSILSLLLDAGTYTVYLTQYSNFGPLVLPGSFPFDNQPDFRDGFVDFYGSQRDGDWALDILNVDSAQAASVPAPAALTLLGLGLAGVALARRRLAA